MERDFLMRMPILAAACLCTLVLAGPATAAPTTFLCDDEQVITADTSNASQAVVTRGDKTWTLPATVTDSGTTYVAESVEFWTEGTEAILTVDGVTAQCLVRPPAE